MFGRNLHTVVGRRLGGWVTAGAFVVGSGAVLVGSPVAADVEAATNRCFSVSGGRGGAAIVNLTPVEAGASGFGLLMSSDLKAEVPEGSNVNFTPASVDPNVAVARIGADGEVCFANSFHGDIDLVADHLGTVSSAAYRPATSNGAPLRRVDTREGLGGTRLPASGQLCFDVSGSPGDAAIVNLTPVLAEVSGFGILISSDIKANVPQGSNVNFAPGSIDPNVAIARIGADGQVCFQNSFHGSVDLVADHLGTIVAPAYQPATATGAPVRRVDTREGTGGSRLPASGQVCFPVAGSPGDAAMVNLTPVNATTGGFGLLVSSTIKASVPGSSNVNFGPGSIDPNVAIAPIGDDGEVCFANSFHGSVDLVADHLGTIAKSAYSSATPTGAPERRVDSRYDVDNPQSKCAHRPTDRYDGTLSRMMMGLASRAYEIDPGATTGKTLDTYGTETVHAADLMVCWQLVAAIRNKVTKLGSVADTEFIVARNPQTSDLVVSFRGTDASLFDIINNVSSARVDWKLPDNRTIANAVHGGFADAYLAARQDLLTVLKAEHRSFVPDARVHFTGHSLGGALATIASLDLSDDVENLGYSSDEIVTYTFGAPRSISRQMAGEHGRFVPKSWAVASPMDPVPQVPTAIGSNHFSHIPQMVILNGKLNTSGVRLDQGDGRNHRGCPFSLPPTPAIIIANFLNVHARNEYDRRLRQSTVSAPTVSITKSNLFSPIVMNWNAKFEGPCDWVGLWRQSSKPTSTSGWVRKRGVVIDTNDQHTTTLFDPDDLWIGYVNIFNEFVVLRR